MLHLARWDGWKEAARRRENCECGGFGQRKHTSGLGQHLYALEPRVFRCGEGPGTWLDVQASSRGSRQKKVTVGGGARSRRQCLSRGRSSGWKQTGGAGRGVQGARNPEKGCAGWRVEGHVSAAHGQTASLRSTNTLHRRFAYAALLAWFSARQAEGHAVDVGSGDHEVAVDERGDVLFVVFAEESALGDRGGGLVHAPMSRSSSGKVGVGDGFMLLEDWSSIQRAMVHSANCSGGIPAVRVGCAHPSSRETHAWCELMRAWCGPTNLSIGGDDEHKIMRRNISAGVLVVSRSSLVVTGKARARWHGVRACGTQGGCTTSGQKAKLCQTTVHLASGQAPILPGTGLSRLRYAERNCDGRCRMC